jgi:hypothetical protein
MMAAEEEEDCLSSVIDATLRPLKTSFKPPSSYLGPPFPAIGTGKISQ